MSMMISNAVSSAAQPAVAASGIKATPQVQRPDSAAQERSHKPVMDEYVPEEKQEPTGRYWLEKGEDGQPKIYFDDPERDKDVDTPEQKAADGKKEEICTGSTDKVDQEIEKLREKKKELEQQINAETDGGKIEALEKELSQVEQELSQKDNDTYRRQHTVFS